MKAGRIFIAAGCVLLAAALCLTLYNVWDNTRAADKAEETLRQISQMTDIIKVTEKHVPTVSAPEKEKPQSTETSDEPSETENSESVSEKTSGIDKESEKEKVYPDYVLDPSMKMPVLELDGINYIGIVELPTLGVTLPIIENLNESNLRSSPCRYVGSVYRSDLVIAGHNYRSHFGSLGSLSYGDIVQFTDMDGNIFVYKVIEIETLDAYANDAMVSGKCDLTLFTCNFSGKKRVTVRCELTEEYPNI